MRRFVISVGAAMRARGAFTDSLLASWLTADRAPLVLAAACAYVSGIAAALAIIFLVAERAIAVTQLADARLIHTLSNASCACILVQYGVATVVAVFLHGQNRAVASGRSLAITALGLLAMAGIVEVQVLALAGMLEPHARIMYVMPGLGVLAIWFVVVGRLGRSSGLLTGRSTLMSLLGASFVAYPIWAFWLGNQLRGLVTPAPPTAAGGCPRTRSEG